MASHFLNPRYMALDGNGKPIAGAKLYTFTAGTTTPVTTYSDNALSSAQASPVVADANGLFPTIYLPAGSYKFKLDNASDVEQWVQDNIAPPIPADNGVIAVANGGTNATTATEARTNLEAAAAADVTTLSTSVATVQAEIDGIPGGSLGDVAALDSVGPTALGTFGDVCLKSHVETSTSEVAISSTTIGFDSSSPQSTEGNEVISFTFTPTRDDSRLRIEYFFGAQLTSGSSLDAVAALFTDLSLSAIDVCTETFGSGHYRKFAGKVEISPGSTSTRTISIRAGVSTGGITINTKFGSSNAIRVFVQELINTPIS